MSLPKNRSVGLEMEFLSVQLENGQAATRDLMKSIWREWGKKKNVETFIDFGTKQPVGVIYTLPDGREMKIDTDAGVDVVEFGFLPFPTLQEGEENLRTIVGEFLGIAKPIGVSLLSAGIQPKTPYYFPDLKSEKIWYRTFLRLYEKGHNMYHNIAANQPNIDLTIKESLDVVNVFNALSPLFIALTANSGVGEWRIQDHHEEREHRWNKWQERNPKISGIPKKPFSSIEDYFHYTWTIPIPAIHRHEESTLHVIESNPDIFDYLQSNKEWQTMDVGRGIPASVRPETEDVNQSLQYIWIQTRLKMEFDEHFGVDQMINSWKEKTLQSSMKKHLNKLYTEVRCIAQQPWDDVIAPAALFLGLIENIEEAKQLTDSKQWDEWRNLREKTLKRSMEVPGVTKLTENMIAISESGLKKRGYGEEMYLKPLKERVRNEESPTMKSIKIFNEKGADGVLNNSLIK